MAINAAGMSGTPPWTLMNHAAIAPMVTSSPCAKLVRPVVPKISESPTAAIAMSRPKRSPSTNSCTQRTVPPPAPVLPSLSAMITPWLRPASTVTVRVFSPVSTTPSGRPSSSMVTVYWPGPGSGTNDVS